MLELPTRTLSGGSSSTQESVPGAARGLSSPTSRESAISSRRFRDGQNSYCFTGDLDNSPMRYSRIVQWALEFEESYSLSLSSPTATPKVSSTVGQHQEVQRSAPQSTTTICRRSLLFLYYAVAIGLIVIYHGFSLIGAVSTTDSLAVWISIVLNFICVTTLVTVSSTRPLTMILGSNLFEQQQSQQSETKDDTAINFNGRRQDGYDNSRSEDEVKIDEVDTTEKSDTLLCYLLSSVNLQPTDATTTRMLWGSIFACFVNLSGEIIFLHKGWTESRKRAQQQQHHVVHDEVPLTYENDYGVSYENETSSYKILASELVLLIVYAASATTVSIVLTLGSGYVALAYNSLAAQLEKLAQIVNQQDAVLSQSPVRGRSNENDNDDCFLQSSPGIRVNQQRDFEESVVNNSLVGNKGSRKEDVDDDILDELGLLLQDGRTPSPLFPNSTNTVAVSSQAESHGDPSFRYVVTATELFNLHVEFRHRQEALKGLHQRFAVVLATGCLVTVILVSQGYIEQQAKTGERIAQTPLLVFALLATFYGLAYSLWSMVFAVGRVLHASRERVGYEVKRWALVCSQQEKKQKLKRQSRNTTSRYEYQPGKGIMDGNLEQDVAQYICAFPIKFHIGIFEFGNDSIKAVVLLLLGLAAAFLGIHVPELI